jgi:hypothetical protein
MQIQLSQYYKDKTDGVSFSMYDKAGKEYRSGRTACYYDVIGSGRPGAGGVDWEIHCRPLSRRNSAPSLIFQRFFRELKRCGLVPQGVWVGTRGGSNTIVVPRQGWGYHPVYITLSLYRHADIHGKSILGRTMYLYGKLQREGVHFLQCLHWSLLNTRHGTWHSCFPISSPSPYTGMSATQSQNLKYGIALAAYGKMALAEKNVLSDRYSTGMFTRLAKAIMDVRVERVDDVLDPQYAHYYQRPHLAAK